MQKKDEDVFGDNDDSAHMLDMLRFCRCIRKVAQKHGRHRHDCDRREKDLRFSFGHAVGKHWTAGAAVSVYTGTVTGNGKGSEMYEHELEFSDIIDDKEESMEASHSETVLMQFWPRKTYEGMFLMIGGRYMNGDGLECILGIGCYLTLWKGLKAAVSIETGLKHAVGNSRLTGLGLCYIF